MKRDNYPLLLEHVMSGREFGPLLRSPERPCHQGKWRALMNDLKGRPPTPALAATFHDQWHVCHHFVRELVDDDALVLDMLWVWLRRYEGPDRVLLRRENIDLFALAVRHGLTAKDLKGTMFAYPTAASVIGYML